MKAKRKKILTGYRPVQQIIPAADHTQTHQGAVMDVSALLCQTYSAKVQEL